MEANSTQVFISFIQQTGLTIFSEISQSAFWFQVAALVISIILSLMVSKAIGHKLLAWESLFQEDTIKDKFWCFVLRLVSKLLFSVFAALFLSLQYRRITVRAVENLVKKYAKIVTPLKKITPHKLRSTYGTELYRETGDIYIVADVLGHRDVNTTRKHYAAISEDHRRAVADAVKLHKPDDLED